MLFKNIDIIDESFAVRRNVFLGVKEDRIAYIGTELPPEDYGETVCGKGRLLMPAFVNAHAHSPMSLMRGYGENLSLQDWLFTRIFPFEAKLTGDAVYWSTLLTAAESLKYGIVATSDMYFFCEDIARAVAESGTKVNVSHAVSKEDGVAFEDMNSIKATRRMARALHGAENGRIRIDASLHAEYTSDEETATKVADLAAELGLNMHVHVSETKTEHEECKTRHQGRTPVRYLADCGLFNTPAIAAHCVWVEDEDREILREKGVTVASNPVSNLKLASGICDVKALQDCGINVALGTDSVASNNNLSMFEEMKTMLLLAKVKHMDPTVISPRQALMMATLNGAKAQGRMDCGSLKVGNKADLIMLRTDTPNMNPVHDLLHNVVLSATDSDLVMTMADGKVLYENGEYKTIDLERAIFEVERSVKDILARI
ncbi:MAG: amidohydrolase [Firmicutes bacterium]|nr:amidohydrolase [Bacillota bacterium]